MNSKIKALFEHRALFETAIDDEFNRLIRAELIRLNKLTGDKWDFMSGMGTWFFVRNDVALHDPVPETEKFLEELSDLNEQMRHPGFYPSFNSKQGDDRGKKS